MTYRVAATTKKLILLITIAAALGVVALVFNALRTRKYSRDYQAHSDILNLAHFFAEYAAANDGNLPLSWGQLKSDGFIGPHPKAELQFLRYTPGNCILLPERCHWVPGDNLNQYAGSDTPNLRVIWLDDEYVDSYDSDQLNTLMLHNYRGRTKRK